MSKHNQRCQASDGTQVCVSCMEPRGGGLGPWAPEWLREAGPAAWTEFPRTLLREGEGCPTWIPQTRGKGWLAVTARVAMWPLAVVTSPLRKLSRAVPGKKREMFSLNNCVTVRACFCQNSLFSWCLAGRWGRERCAGQGAA